MRVAYIILTIFITSVLNAGFVAAAGDNRIESPTLRGYVRNMPALRLDKDFSDPSFTNLFHNRLNFRWNISSNFHLVAEGRNRLFYNTMFKDYPQYSDILGRDGGLMDLSWVWLSDGPWIGHSMADRLYADWRGDKWQVRVGRQRINWGINLVSNPNDLFNTYSFFDFDYPERPGSDAIRIQHFTGDLSRIQLAVSPARNSRKTVAAAMLGTNWRGYDVQAVTGYYRHRLALGGGWAGSIGGAGFKGEATWFHDIEEEAGTDRSNIVASTGIDYMFANGTFGVVEFLYNGGYNRRPGEVFMITEPLRPDNIMFSKYAVTLSAQRALSPILQGRLAVMALPDIDAAFLMPGIDYSLTRDLDLEFVGQIFLGGSGTIFEEAGAGFFVALQYSF
ncbi:MAG: hypothetical protein EA408_00025 [Marinilabiliales bacterium]|nr:MAG: hypothetical protein EA408_00025 [Marinilabiliales bacterium]